MSGNDKRANDERDNASANDQRANDERDNASANDKRREASANDKRREASASDKRDNTSDKRDNTSDKRGSTSDKRDNASANDKRDNDERGNASDKRDNTSDKRDNTSDKRDNASDKRDNASDKRGTSDKRREAVTSDKHASASKSDVKASLKLEDEACDDKGAPATAEEKPATPRWMKWLTRISLVIGIGALIATVWIVGPTVIVGHLRAIGWFFAVIISLEILSSVCDATAVYYMAQGPGHPRWREAVVAQLAGRGVNSVTPGGNLGEALKVGLLSQRCSAKRIIAAVMYVQLMIGVVSLAFVAIGTGATAFLFDVPNVGIGLLLVGALVAAAVAGGIYMLLRRGMLTTLTGTLARVRIISKERRDRWNKTLEEVDHRLRGQDVDHRRHALVFIFASQALQKTIAFLVVYAAGYTLSPGQFLALVSAGVLLGWISTIIPMGLGILEGGNVALFSLIGAPASLGLALSLSRRVNQIMFAIIGFIVLTTDKVGTSIHGKVRTRWPKQARPAGAH